MGMSAPHPVAPRVGLRGCKHGGCRANVRFYPAHPRRTGAKDLAGAIVLRHVARAQARCMASKIADSACQPKMPRSPATKPDAVPYEDALAELEQLVQAMERAQMPLDQMLTSYRRGAELLHLCHGRLQAVEEQVKLLEDGQMKPWAAA